jgi:hypothetical protein
MMDAAACAPQWECATAASSSTKRSSSSNGMECEEEEVEEEDGCAAMDMLFDDASGSGAGADCERSQAMAAPGAAAPAPAGLQGLPGTRLLGFLNLNRTTQGYWKASKELAGALGLPLHALLLSRSAGAAGVGVGAGAGVQGVGALRPAGLSDDAWCTTIVLGVLRCRLAAERAGWPNM